MFSRRLMEQAQALADSLQQILGDPSIDPGMEQIFDPYLTVPEDQPRNEGFKPPTTWGNFQFDENMVTGENRWFSTALSPGAEDEHRLEGIDNAEKLIANKFLESVSDLDAVRRRMNIAAIGAHLDDTDKQISAAMSSFENNTAVIGKIADFKTKTILMLGNIDQAYRALGEIAEGHPDVFQDTGPDLGKALTRSLDIKSFMNFRDEILEMQGRNEKPVAGNGLTLLEAPPAPT